MLLPSLIQITKSISGSVVPLAMFCHLLKYLSKMDLSALLTPTLSDYHRLRRPLHGSIHCSCVAVVYPTLELICDFRPSKFSNYPSRPVPLPELFVTTRPDPVPKSKTTTRQSLAMAHCQKPVPLQRNTGPCSATRAKTITRSYLPPSPGAGR